MASPVNNILASAKSTLNKAKDFTKSVEGKEPSSFAPKPREFSGAPYSMAKKASMPDMEKTAEGLKAKRTNVEDYLKAYPNK